MLPLLQPILETTATILRATRDAILPFSEQPPAGEEDTKEVQTLKASDLFSCFTADIIQKDVVFTR